ncbi:MAG: lipopolysaccharide core heptose(I) kinase RfaP [Gammaproteobacteria bacterium GWE2_42_36]|nr:MAG: lipopolysaccharide core heptose(I) kinase RfaP [Gammaproteobacteria bacterium GWE2_42_36]HCU05910.1 lipopolysaccharide core heptose(I) kinase RfaP [Coxiellaceae bacterium]
MAELYVRADFQALWDGGQPIFDQLMSIQGEVFRDKEGRKTLRFERGGRYFYVKQHFGIGWKEIFKNLAQLRYPILSAKTEWLAIQAVKKLGISTLEIVAYGCRGANPARQQSFLVTEELTEVESLESFCASWEKEPPSFSLKLKLIQAVAQIARLLHQTGLNHRDFYLCHFLIKHPYDDFFQLYLIDLHRMQRRKKIPLRWRIKDIAGLYFSSMDRGLTQKDLLRFLRCYFKTSLRTILAQEKNFLQAVQWRAMTLYRKTYQREAQAVVRSS